MIFKLHWSYSLLMVLVFVIVGLHFYNDTITFKTVIGFVIATAIIFVSNDRYHYIKAKNAAKE